MDFAFTTAPERVSASMCKPMAWEALRQGHGAYPVAVRRGPDGLFVEMETPGEAFPADPFVYGHTGLVSVIAQGSSPGWRVDWSADQYDRELWIQRCGDLMWNKDAQILTLSEALEAWTSGPMHLCPSGADSGPKAFKGFFCDRSELAFELPRAGKGNILDPSMRVALSPPDEPEREYRCVIIQGRLVAAGLYFENRSLVETTFAPPRVEAFANEAARVWLPGEFCVMDIAVKGDRMGVVEYNSLHSAGLYSILREPVVRGISEAWPRAPRPKNGPA